MGNKVAPFLWAVVFLKRHRTPLTDNAGAEGQSSIPMAYHKIAFATGILLVAHASAAYGAITAAGAVPCLGTKQIGDTVGIVLDRTKGSREQSLVEARLGIVAGGKVIGTLYIDDQGERYIEAKPGISVPGIRLPAKDGKTYPLPLATIFGGTARLRACQP